MGSTVEALRRSGRGVLARVDAWANRAYTSRYNPLYHSGSITVALLAVLIATGLYLLLFYRIGAPWASVSRITEQAWAGRWIRGVHRFASDAAVVAAAIHAFRMYAQRRSWGPRALAWVSGLVLVGIIFVSGWTGYVMVWDVHAQVLAVEWARFLDVLPIFSEPIGRSFVGERELPSAFFFMVLFPHVALPTVMGVVLWVHVARVARPALLPPRPVLWGVVVALVLLAVAWPVGMAAEAELLRVPVDVPLDLFYAFWIPLTRGLPAWSVWAAGAVLVALGLLAPLWTRPAAESRPEKSWVNERYCTGCTQCVQDCPYDAIAMVAREDGREGLVARVNQDVCVSCGVCIGSCAPMAVGPVGRTGRDQIAQAREFLERERPGAGDVVVIGCEWGAAGAGALPPGVAHFPIACAGNVHTSTIEMLVRQGVGGVLVAACPAEDCRSREGGKWLEARVHHGREAELQERVDRRRVRIVEAASAEGTLLRASLAGFQEEVRALRLDGDEDEIDLVALCRSEAGAGAEEVA